MMITYSRDNMSKSMCSLVHVAVSCGLAFCIMHTASATEPASLSSFQPITVEDAYPAKIGSIEIDTSFRWDHEAEGRNLFEPRGKIKWGALQNLELALSVPYRFGNTSDRDSGQVALDALYAFADDRDWMPAMAISPSIAFPLGKQQGTETQLSFLATKSLSGRKEGPNLHFNASWLHVFDAGRDQREDRYSLVVGYSHPLRKTTALVFDVVHEQGKRKGDINNLVEVGARQLIAEETVMSFGVGAGIGKDSPIARVVVGLQRSF